ncbi:hypothetical protein SLEP1_g14923, partial [Rubroshorea leprosula]
PKKRDRFGRTFGFVRFLEVKDEKELECQLDQIWIGNPKLKANIPRFKEDRDGVPLHSWGSTFFSTLSCIWGKFITLDESTSKKKHFDIARFLICTPVMDSISKKIKVNINGTVYNIKVEEEEFSNSLFSIKSGFIPDFPSDSEIGSKETWEIDSVEDEASKGVDMEVEKLFSDMEIGVPREKEEDVALIDWMVVQNSKTQTHGFGIDESN